MKKRVVVFGVGKNFKTNRDLIYQNYDVVGLIDNNANNINVKGVMNPTCINNMEYDFILITPNDYIPIKNQLLDMGVSKEKIVVLKYDTTLWGDVNNALKYSNSEREINSWYTNINKIRHDLSVMIGKVEYQNFWKELYFLALEGQNLGLGGYCEESGEIGVIKLGRADIFLDCHTLTPSVV